MWRGLIRRLLKRRVRHAPTPLAAAVDVWATVDRIDRPSSDVLSRIEQTALAVYAAHGLPTRAGHYRRGPRARSWTFLGEQISPEARFETVLNYPPEKGWRYGTLPDLGRAGPPEVQLAASLLTGCAHLQGRLARAGTAEPLQDLELAVRLGADWRALESGRVRGGGARLRLTAPDDKDGAAPSVSAP